MFRRIREWFEDQADNVDALIGIAVLLYLDALITESRRRAAVTRGESK